MALSPVSNSNSSTGGQSQTLRFTLPVPPRLALYVLIPLLFLALPLALLKIAVGPDTSIVVALFLWSATVMVGWISGAVGSEIIFRLCARWRPPLWFITLGGPLVVGFLLRQPILEILTLAQSLHSSPVASAPSVGLSLDFIIHFLCRVLPGAMSWMLANYIFDRVLGVPRYRYPPKGQNNAPTSPDVMAFVDGKQERPANDIPTFSRQPQLLQRLPQAQRGALIALKSDDHYVRVYTDAGDTLILMRLRDAIKLSAPVIGMQIHRSHWVAQDAVRCFLRTGHTGVITLVNGLEIAVSRSYVRDVERAFGHLSAR